MRGSGKILTGVRGNFYMNHLLKNELESIKRDGTFASPLGDCKNAFVACNDMAEAAVTCFREAQNGTAISSTTCAARSPRPCPTSPPS